MNGAQQKIWNCHKFVPVDTSYIDSTCKGILFPEYVWLQSKIIKILNQKISYTFLLKIYLDLSQMIM
jgi:hypothetical protein